MEPTFVPLVKPCNKQMLLNTIEILMKTSQNIYKLEDMVATLKNNEKEQYITERAKKLLMKNMHLTEKEAHRRLQKESMDKGISKIKIAQSIIALYEEG
jgi:response regulator NasT